MPKRTNNTACKKITWKAMKRKRTLSFLLATGDITQAEYLSQMALPIKQWKPSTVVLKDGGIDTGHINLKKKQKDLKSFVKGLFKKGKK